MSLHTPINLLILACGGLFTTTVAFAALWIAARERAIRAALERGQRDNKPDVNAEMDRLMNMVDTIAVEVERISEGQRFTTKVLAERLDAPASARKLPEKSITPH
jgi:hypothetical protein